MTDDGSYYFLASSRLVAIRFRSGPYPFLPSSLSTHTLRIQPSHANIKRRHIDELKSSLVS